MTDQPCFDGNLSKYKILISRQEIDRRVKELARQISDDYRDKCPILIGVLNGAFIFLSDLIREMDIDCEVDFVKISSYGGGRVSTGQIKTKKLFDSHVDGRHILIVEDIADSGRSIKFLEQMFEGTKPASLKFASLLLKEGNAVVDFKLDYVGFTIPTKFVVGYGLDYDQKYRNLRDIYVLD
ncbi:MAG: hypoxanthine phosphoribosyltransferase [candidate division KSB1 bacterium]|nr:hypoxanthine phosphoribosyltransferase [candidate division KSB1 bacterium]MDZ7333849.1 hypoxanthine phosphoribosyltransferase [candidate division KSB1 bacterium]MDZ7356092.1 hypoxanthine phosphoribosyltransferase [candidate division KSB1 bacterium]MDZ7377633.1 hypoxanthine phosphoribosyltransferase [candidate division KSB1 bacterium]MDZ7400609.1 hypoxanthine phosphoribosyltransferase [candidate division KSB1 bacterium]